MVFIRLNWKKMILCVAMLAGAGKAMSFLGRAGYEKNINLVKTELPQKHSDWINLEVTSDAAGQGFDAYTDLSLRLYHGRGDYIFSFSEAYLSHIDEKTTYTLGRKIINWDIFDAYWQQGDFNGKRGFYLLEEEQEGLVGFLAEEKISNNFKFSFFGSYLFVPTLNPDYKVESGKLKTTSHWEYLPPSHANIQGVSRPIHYNLHIPPMKKIILNESLGLKLDYAWKGGKISGHGIHKPENKFRFNAEGYLDKNLEKVIVNVHPFVNHHFIYGLNVEQNINNGDYSLESGLKVVDPNGGLNMNLLLLGELNFQNHNRNNFGTRYIKLVNSYKKKKYFHFRLKANRPKFNMSFNYIYLLNQHKMNNSGVFFGPAVKWVNALGLTFNYRFTDSLKYLFDSKYDLFNEDSILVNQVSYKFLKNKMALNFGWQLLKSKKFDSYWYRYQKSDLVYSGLTYSY